MSKLSENNDFVVYTAISHNYDFLRKVPKGCKDIKFICFSDSFLRDNVNGWDILPLPNCDIDSTRRCRAVKLNPHLYLPDYKYSLWVDGNIQIYAEFYGLIEHLIYNNISIATFRHPFRTCIYQEGEVCKNLNKDEALVIEKHMEYLKSEGYPKDLGLSETNVLFRQHMNAQVIKFCQTWNQVLNDFSKRDQLSFNYALWRSGLDMTIFSGSVREGNSPFRIGRHRSSGVRCIRSYIEAYYFESVFGQIFIKAWEFFSKPFKSHP